MFKNWYIHFKNLTYIDLLWPDPEVKHEKYYCQWILRLKLTIKHVPLDICAIITFGDLGWPLVDLELCLIEVMTPWEDSQTNLKCFDWIWPRYCWKRCLHSHLAKTRDLTFDLTLARDLDIERKILSTLMNRLVESFRSPPSPSRYLYWFGS